MLETLSAQRQTKGLIMRTGKIFGYLFWASIFLSSAILGQEIDLSNLPPVVIQTYPVSGDNKVDPQTTEIKVVFSKKMKDKCWSFCLDDKNSFPKIEGEPYYDQSRRTCSLKVKLQADKTYIIWINSQKFKNFKDLKNNPAVPYLLAFKTAGNLFTEKKTAAVEAAEKWLQLLKNGNFSDSWDTAAPFFKKNVQEQAWVDQMSKINKNLGAVESRKLIGAKFLKSLPGVPKGQYFILQFQTSFAKKPSAIETITPMLDKDGKWKISGYYIK